MNLPAYKITTLAFLASVLVACQDTENKPTETTPEQPAVLQPVVITDTVPNDTDDPAVWINHANPAESLIIGTDKDSSGGLYVFDLKGKMDTVRSVRGLGRPNNVDIEYGLILNGKPVDIAVTTERFTHKLRIYSLPDMKPVDNGGIPVFEGEKQPEFRDLMGISLYKDPAGNIYAIAGRKTGPTDNTYLWQYLLKDDGKGNVKAELARKFGKYSGKKEIEAIAVDDKLGYIYYSDEQVGVRKYYADPAKGNQELALFADTGFAGDHEGISIYSTSDSTGFIIVSDQQADQFKIFAREGTAGAPHQHTLLRTVKVAAHESDGSESVSVPLGPDFPKGIFVAMSDERTFHYYKPEQLLGDSLLKK
ncbi:phytase [Terrimonas sp. NA20]|uniref:Phytase n=1 Tax=Terrimonas ginsenosidimutans TaxID=2908004 RepID=A0ABS9KV39_9BACT|nr:phytase [Terrimonas ginsenosidimutans]MCG2616178.1 phytase [Terrimonas ginsenosidimutans]